MRMRSETGVPKRLATTVVTGAVTGVVAFTSAGAAGSPWALETGPAQVRTVAAPPAPSPSLEFNDAGPAALNAADAAMSLMPQAATEPEDAPVVEAGPSSIWKGWSGSVEGGLNGSDGNSESLNIRAAFNAQRKSDTMETKFRSEYSYATNGGEKEKNRWFNELRNDWLLGTDKRWSFFALGQVEYDDFQDWNWRLSAFVGPGYKLVKTDKTTLNARAGAGLTKYIGGETNEIIPEGLLALDVEHQLTERQKLTGSFEYYPSFKQFSEYRIVARAGWEILVDPAVNMMLKLGVEDRYDSNPGDGFKKNDIDYFAMIGWKF